MRLSEHMRLGSMLEPHLRYADFADGKGGCAMQMALVSLGERKNNWKFLTKKFPWILEERFSDCPCKDCSLGLAVIGELATPGAIIIHLNDGHKWHLDEIADWVASVEPKDDNENTMLAARVSDQDPAQNESMALSPVSSEFAQALS